MPVFEEIEVPEEEDKAHDPAVVHAKIMQKMQENQAKLR